MRLSEYFAQDEVQVLNRGALEQIFEEEPVSLEVFVGDRKYLSNPPLSPVQFEAVQHIERIYLPELYPALALEFGGYWAEPVRMTNLITLQFGKGAGKDHIARVASLRIAYLLLCLRSPQRYYSMPEQDSIHLLNIASNSAQAYRAFFKPLTVAVKRGWFADKASPTQNAIQYDKQVEAISGHSEAESQEGLNLMLGVADEIDAFKAKEEMIGQGKKMREATTSAESILDLLKTSASTRFPSCYKRVAISYPRYKGSTIQRLTLEARKDNAEFGADSIYYVRGPLATWEVNPRVSGPEVFASDYRKDPAAAAAKYECKPTRANDAYFKNPDAVRAAMVGEEEDAAVILTGYELVKNVSDVTGQSVESWEPVFAYRPDFLPKPGALYAMHADMAVTNDRAGIALSHVTRQRETTVTLDVEQPDGEIIPTEMTQTVSEVMTDFVLAFEADLGALPVREIQLRWARKLAFDLIQRGFPIRLFSMDGFQSVDNLQTFALHGIPTKKVSTDTTPDIWKTLKDLIYDGRYTVPYSDLLLNEFQGLSKVSGKVDHQIGGSKDLADAVACSAVGALEIGGSEETDPAAPIFESGLDEFESGNPLPDLFGFEEYSLVGSDEGWI
jgi:hypothetical protein